MVVLSTETQSEEAAAAAVGRWAIDFVCRNPVEVPVCACVVLYGYQ